VTGYEPSRQAKLAAELARESAQEETLRIVPVLQPMNQEERILYFATRFSVLLGHMRAAIGHDAARAVVDALKQHTDELANPFTPTIDSSAKP
jgi:hypothetical protein